MEQITALLADPNTYISLATLTFLEIVLGIDNIIFLSILTGRLPEHQQAKARNVGLSLAVVFRIGLLFCISWLASFTAPLFAIGEFHPSTRDFILMAGGLFLLAKGTLEIHSKVEENGGPPTTSKHPAFLSIIAQIVVIDMVFSLDSVITAVGLVPHLSIMVVAILLSLIVMLALAKQIGDFIHKHPTVKILALAFLILIGVMLFMEGTGVHVPKGYIYFAMAFSAAVEAINMRVRDRAKANH